MRRALKFAALGAALFVLGVIALVVFGTRVVAPRLATPLAGQVAQALGRAVQVSSVSVALVPMPAVRLKGIEIAEDTAFGDTAFATLDQVDVRLRLAELLHGDVVIDAVVLARPRIRIIRHTDGAMNVDSLGQTQPDTAHPAPVDDDTFALDALLGAHVRVDGGIVNYLSQGANDTWSEFDLEDVVLTLINGAPLTFEGTAQLQPGDVAIGITDGSVASAGVTAIGDAPLRGHLVLGARDITELAAALLGPAPAINGGLTGTADVAGTLARPTASGTLDLPGVALTRTSPQCPAPQRRTLTLKQLSAQAAWEDNRFISRPATAELTNGTITANLVIAVDGSVRVELGDLTVTALPLQKVLVDYFCEGHAVTGLLDLTGSLSFGTGLSGVGQLHIGRGQVVGTQALDLLAGIVRVGGAVSALLSIDLPWSLFSSPLDFDSISATYQIANGVLHLRDLRYDSSAMRISGGGLYELATDRLDLDLVVNHGRGQVYAKVTGPADSPSIHVTPTTILRDIHPGQIGHGVENFFRDLF